MKHWWQVGFWALTGLIALSWGACRPADDLLTDPGVRMRFSTDTLTFDTVFTTAGSATRLFKIYNDQDQRVKLSRVYLEKGAASMFRLNVDGIPGKSVTDVEILPKDSIYVFVEVTVNPDAPLSVSPFVIEENCLIELNGNVQKVVLTAWGQNANYVTPPWGLGRSFVLSCDLQTITWDDPKPYIIFGTLVIDSCEVVLPPGTRVYIHGGLGTFKEANPNGQDSITRYFNDGRILLSPTAKLVSKGTLEQPVVIQGDRLEQDFLKEPGQWFGIYAFPGSKGHDLQYTQILNATFGLILDSASSATLKNCQLLRHANTCFLASHAEVTADNCLFHTSGSATVSLGYGGKHRFRHCTIANYGSQAPGLSMSNRLCLDQECKDKRLNGLDALFVNCLIYGNQEDMINLAAEANAPFVYKLEQTVVRVKKLLEVPAFANFFSFCAPCDNTDSRSKVFRDALEQNFQLDTLSVAENKALFLPDLSSDLDGAPRTPGTTDAGCYEFKPR